jgi:hypothetical protein
MSCEFVQGFERRHKYKGAWDTRPQSSVNVFKEESGSLPTLTCSRKRAARHKGVCGVCHPKFSRQLLVVSC